MTSKFTVHKFFRFLGVGVVCSLPIVATAVYAQTSPRYQFTVINRTDSPITELYVDDIDKKRWDESLLGNDPIAPDDSADFAWEDDDWEDGDPCLYDVFTRSKDGAEGFAQGIDFCVEEGEILVIEVFPKEVTQ